MIVIPAIDLKDGNCVRLYRGDYSTVHKVADSPLETALTFQQLGATWLHMVDLDGAKDGMIKNQDIILRVCNETSLKVEVGGGIRDMETVDYYLQNGVSRVIFGSAAVKNKQLVVDAVKKYGEKIAVGIDAINGMACAEGWMDNSGVDFCELAVEMEKIGVSKIIFTDISKDGMLSGPNLTQLDELKSAVSCDIIASGGIANLKDIINLAELNIYGAITGKAIYSGDLSLPDAIKIGERVENMEKDYEY